MFGIRRRKDDAAYLRAAALGAAAGFRAVLPLGLLATSLGRRGRMERWVGARQDGPVARALSTRPASLGLPAMAAGELVADKLPFMPDRVKPPILASRLAMGALAGGVVGELGGRSPWVGALIGAGSALAAAFAGYLSRTTLADRTPIPQQVWGAVEDGVAVALGARALNLGRR